MTVQIFDTHAHYDDEAFDTDRHQLLAALPEMGVCRVLNAASNIDSAKQCIDLAAKYDHIYAAVGIHPNDGGSAPPDWYEQLYALSSAPKVVAIGEIGLDYHYDDTDRPTQLALFEGQLRLACELSLPVIIHDREAHGDTLELLKKYKPQGVIHCFSGSVEMAREVLDLGLYIGLGGAVTFKNAKKPVEVAKIVPIDRLLLETDCPYMSPVPMRGKRCDSSLIKYTAEKIAELRGEDADYIINAARQNGERLFNISKEE